MAPTNKIEDIVVSTRDTLENEVESFTNFDDQSDCSVGAGSVTSITQDEMSEHPMYSELASKLSTKQEEISLAFAGMVSNMAVMINEKETENERLLGHDPTESHAKRQEQVDKCTKAVTAMAKKQAKLARQFERLVNQLEEQNREKESELVRLKKHVTEMKNRMSKIKGSSERNLISPASRRHLSLQGSSALQRTPLSPKAGAMRSASFKQSGTDKLSICLDEATEHTEAFTIKEISFTSTIVDIEEMMSRMNDESLSNFSETAGDNVRLIL